MKVVKFLVHHKDDIFGEHKYYIVTTENEFNEHGIEANPLCFLSATKDDFIYNAMLYKCDSGKSVERNGKVVHTNYSIPEGAFFMGIKKDDSTVQIAEEASRVNVRDLLSSYSSMAFVSKIGTPCVYGKQFDLVIRDDCDWIQFTPCFADRIEDPLEMILNFDKDIETVSL